MKLIFMGTPEFAVPSLARLISDGHEVAAVFTQPDKPAGRGNKLQPPPIKMLAAQHEIAVHQPTKIKTNEEVRDIFNQIAPDACVVVAYGKILPAWLLAIPRLGCINVHASILPYYRGAAPINWAIARGERETGVTVMQMDQGMDTGPMLSMKIIDIGEEETAPELSARLSQLGAELLSATLPLCENGEVEAVAQDDSIASYAPILKREDGLIDWNMTANEIANRVRAFQPWPGTYTNFRGGRLIIWRAHPLANHQISDTVAPATIAAIEKNGLVISCAGSSALIVEELQVEGKRRVVGRDFVNGMRLSVGDRITD